MHGNFDICYPLKHLQPHRLQRFCYKKLTVGAVVCWCHSLQVPVVFFSLLRKGTPDRDRSEAKLAEAFDYVSPLHQKYHLLKTWLVAPAPPQLPIVPRQLDSQVTHLQSCVGHFLVQACSHKAHAIAW